MFSRDRRRRGGRIVSTGVVMMLAFALSGGPVEATAPAVRVTPTTTIPASARCGQWWALAEEVGWPADELPTLDRVMWCESHCEPGAHNRSGASGLMQIMPMWWDGRDPYDPAVNLAMAVEVHEAQGWPAWSCAA
jgi:soluble lytic murein transglycosylase-like protein